MATYCLEDGGDIEPYSCPICFEDYDLLDLRRTPKLLLCLHTFCFECTQKLWKVDGTLECSMCRMRHEQVSLDDLFDNHVIIQHLRLEREKADLEFAREIEKELRSSESESILESPNNPVLEEQNDVTDDVIEILDTTDIDEEEEETNEIMTEEDSPSIINVDDSQEEIERNDCPLYLDLFENLRHSSQSDSDSDEEEDNDDGEENGDDDNGINPLRGEGPDNSSDEGNEDSENPVFCFSNFSEIMDQDKDEDIRGGASDNEDEDDTNEEVYENPSFMVENFTCSSFGIDDDDNDADEEEEEEEDRFHSACDDISTSHWVSNDLQVHEGSEDDADSTAYCWQILSPETLMDE